MKRPRLRLEDYTVAWICSLPVEFAAAAKILDEEHSGYLQGVSTSDLYVHGRINHHNVVLACANTNSTGESISTEFADWLLSRYSSVRFCFMVGIGSGVPSHAADIRLGDVVVGQPTFLHGGMIQYDLGRMESGDTAVQTGQPSIPPSQLLLATSILQSRRHFNRSDFLSNFSPITSHGSFGHDSAVWDRLFKAEYQHIPGVLCEQCREEEEIKRIPRKRKIPKVHYGTIASSNQAIRDGVTRNRVSARLGGVLCFDTEATGLQVAVPSLAIRGISDYADSHKNLMWQSYAAATAAAYAKELFLFLPGVLTTEEIPHTKRRKRNGDPPLEPAANSNIRAANVGLESGNSAIYLVKPSTGSGKSDASRSSENLSQKQEQPRLPREADWAHFKDVIRNIYIKENKTLKQLMDVMARTYSFVAPKIQFQRRLKMWGLRKNLKSSEWQYVAQMVASRTRQGKSSALYVDGVLVPEKRLRKEIARTTVSVLHSLRFDPCLPAPEGITVTTPPPSSGPSIRVDDLPWLVFQDLMETVQMPLIKTKPSSEKVDSTSLVSSSQLTDANIPQAAQFILLKLISDQPPIDVNEPASSLFSYLQTMMTEKHPRQHSLLVHGLFSSSHATVLRSYFSIIVYLASNNLIDIRRTYAAVKWAWIVGGEDFLRSVFSISGETVKEFISQVFFGALRYQDKQIVQLAIENGANLDTRVPYSEIWHHTSKAKNEDFDAVEFLLELGVDPTSLPAIADLNAGMQMTRVELMNRYGQIESQAIAFSNGPIEEWSSREWTGHSKKRIRTTAIEPYHSQTLPHDLEIENRIHGGFLMSFERLNVGETALQTAVAMGNLELVKMLLDAGADVNAAAAPLSGRTALQIAAEIGELRILELLLAKGADVNFPAADRSGRTALQAAAGAGHYGLVKHLIEFKADVNGDAAPYSGLTALQAAVKTGHVELVAYLIDVGADFKAPAAQNSGRTALQIAVEINNTKLVDILLQAGAEINDPAAPYSGRTALQAAAEAGNLEMVEYLIDHEADVNGAAALYFGKSALQAAAETGNLRLVKRLIKEGADPLRDLDTVSSSDKHWLPSIAAKGQAGIVYAILNASMSRAWGKHVSLLEAAIEAAVEKRRIDMVHLLCNAMEAAQNGV